MVRHEMPEPDWSKLRNVYGKPAGSSRNQPEERRLEAEAEFWDSINGDSALCTATAPALAEYLGILENAGRSRSSGLG
jgi:hypothetical protein